MSTTLGHDPLRVAEYILWRLRDSAVTPMQLLKLVYVSHGWMLGLYGRPLINSAVECWPYGPVIPSVYQAYKRFGGSAITAIPDQEPSGFSSAEVSVMRQVCDGYGRYTGMQLSTMTHHTGTPWDTTRLRNARVIPDDLIEDFYNRKAQQAGAAGRAH